MVTNKFLQNNIAHGHAGRQELVAMVESKMNEPKSTGFDDPQEWNENDLRTFLREVRSANLKGEVFRSTNPLPEPH